LLFVEEILGLREEPGKSSSPMHTMMDTVLEAYRNAKERKDYALVDAIRANVKKEGIVIRDAKTGISWDYEE
jgi:cysteinyl-tRNA synthetase